MVGYKGFWKNDPLLGTDRETEVTTLWSDVLLARPENLMTGVSFTRGGYHRIGRNVTAGLGGYTVHRPGHWLFDGTGLGYGDVLGAGATVVGYECDGCAFTYRDGLPYPTGEDGTPPTFEILGTCPTQHFTRDTRPRPPKPGEPSELEYLASRVFGTRDAEAMERIRHGHAVLGAYTNEAGATVVTSGSTDWAHGLAGPGSAGRADHPERTDEAGVTHRRHAGRTDVGHWSAMRRLAAPVITAAVLLAACGSSSAPAPPVRPTTARTYPPVPAGGTDCGITDEMTWAGPRTDWLPGPAIYSRPDPECVRCRPRDGHLQSRSGHQRNLN